MKFNKSVSLLFVGLTIMIISFYIGYNIYKYKKMEEHPFYTQGIITGIAFSSKMGYSINYQFAVESILYKGASLKKNNDIFNIGDSCLIIYDNKNITINNLYRDKLGYLYLINNQDSIKEDWDMYLDSLLLERRKKK